MADFGSITPMVGNKQPRVEEQAQVLNLPKDEYVQGRLAGPIQSIAYYWFTIKTPKGKTPTTDIPKICLDYDPKTQKMVRDICPYRASGLGRLSQVYYMNFLVRDIQENKPSKKRMKKLRPHGRELKKRELLDGFKCHIKQFGTKTWTPWRLLRLTATMATKAKNLGNLNVHKGKKYPIADIKYGMDINVMHAPDEKGSAQYDVQRADKTRLTQEELDYPMQPLNTSAFKPLSLKEAKADWEQLKKIVVKPKSKDEKEGKNSKKKKKNRDKERDDKKSSKKSKDKAKKSSSKKKSGKKKSQFSKWDM